MMIMIKGKMANRRSPVIRAHAMPMVFEHQDS